MASSNDRGRLLDWSHPDVVEVRISDSSVNNEYFILVSIGFCEQSFIKTPSDYDIDWLLVSPSSARVNLPSSTKVTANELGLIEIDAEFRIRYRGTEREASETVQVLVAIRAQKDVDYTLLLSRIFSFDEFG